MRRIGFTLWLVFCFLMIGLLFDGAYAANNISIVSNEGEGVTFPPYLIHISPRVKRHTQVFAHGDGSHPIILYLDHSPEHTTKTLQKLSICVKLLTRAAWKDGKRVPLKEIDEQTVFVHLQINPLLASVVKDTTNKELFQLFSCAHFLEIRPLVTSYASFIAARLDKQLQVKSIEGQLREKGFLSSELPSSYLNNLRRQFTLYKQAIEEKSVADLLSLYGHDYLTKNAMLMDTLDLRNKGITDLSGLHLIPHPEIFRFLNLSNNFITDIDRTVFKPFIHVDRIYLNNNWIHHIDRESFHHCPRLKYLSLSHNRLTHLKQGIFAGLHHLDHLYLANNQISHIERGVFHDTPQLVSLRLNSNRLSTVEKGIYGRLSQLSFLDLTRNQILDIQPGALANLPRLKRLDLSRNSIHALSRKCFQNLPSLVTLLLEENRIQHLEEGTFLYIPSVKVLCLRKNHLKQLQPQTFQGLSHLIELDLRENLIQGIPRETFKCTPKLVVLHLNDNQLNDLTSAPFEPLPNLQKLGVSGNPLNVTTMLFFQIKQQVLGWQNNSFNFIVYPTS